MRNASRSPARTRSTTSASSVGSAFSRRAEFLIDRRIRPPLVTETTLLRSLAWPGTRRYSGAPSAEPCVGVASRHNGGGGPFVIGIPTLSKVHRADDRGHDAARF